MGAGSRAVFALTSMVFLAGACVLLFLVILGGTLNKNVLNQIYFLGADTSNIPGAPPYSRWTLWSVCGVTADGRNNCPGARPAVPLDPPNALNFGTTTGVPQDFLGTGYYFYMTRFMFAFFLIALFFAVVSFFLAILALFGRLFSYLTAFSTLVAVFFQALAASLMTAAYVKGMKNFQNNGRATDLGRYAFGFTWAAFAALFIASALLCLAGGMSKKGEPTSSGRFGRKKNPNRGSFIDNESQRRVNEEYK